MNPIGLRLRIMIPVAAVLIAALVALGAFTRLAVQVEFDEFLETRDRGPATPLMLGSDRIEELARTIESAGWREGEALLGRWRRDGVLRSDLILLDAAGRMRVVASGWVAPEEVTADGPDRLRIDVTRDGNRALLAVPTSGPPLTAADGSALGTVVALPPRPGDLAAESEGSRIAGRVNRTAMAAAIVLAILALASAWWAVSRALAPVETLRRGVQAVAAGDLSRRVPEERRDELGRLASAFNTMAAALERGERLRRHMVADVAHELRTPLTALRCQLEALQDGLAAPEPRRIDSLHEEVVVLGRLVDDLALLAEAEAGTLAIEPRALDLAAEVERAVEGIRASVAGDPRIEVTIDRGVEVEADPVRLQQILRNLLSNGLRHGAQPVRVRAIAEGEREWVRVEVSDAGPGLGPEEVERVYDRFYRGDPSRDRGTGGSGIGLAIVRRLVEAQGGTVGVASEPGSGATFWIDLPKRGASPRPVPDVSG